MRIGFLSDQFWISSDTLTRLREFGKAERYQIETLEQFSVERSVVKSAWALINLVDVVIVQVTGESNNIFYEIGLAHGLGKPVIILANNEYNFPPDLKSQRILLLEDNGRLSDNLLFRLKELLLICDTGKYAFLGLRGPREEFQYLPKSEYVPQVRFRDLFGFEGARRVLEFEKWFVDVASAVPGWEVDRPTRFNRTDTYDLVVWNSNNDTELSILGNPIPFELKAINSMNALQLHRFLEKTHKSGLKGLVLATAGVNRKGQELLNRLRKEQGINAIALDRDDLINVGTPDDLVKAIKGKVRELLYGRSV